MYLVYILKSLKDNEYYIGQTNNLDLRLKRHNTGLIRSTRNRIPLILIKKEFYNTRGETRQRENYLKNLKGGNEFRKIVGH